MLAQTVRNNLRDISSLKMRSKTTKFSSLFQSAPTVEFEVPDTIQVLSKDGLVEICEDDSIFDEVSDIEMISVVEDDCIEDEFEIVEDEVTEEEIMEYIVENPSEVVVQFPLVAEVEVAKTVPFFKALSLKLANL